MAPRFRLFAVVEAEHQQRAEAADLVIDVVQLGGHRIGRAHQPVVPRAVVRRHVAVRHTRVVLTASAQEAVDETESKRVQADGLLRKPFEASLLLDTLKPLLELARQQRGESVPRGRPGGERDGSAPAGPFVAVIDPEQVRAAVTVALDASFEVLINEITEKVLAALSTKPVSKGTHTV